MIRIYVPATGADLAELDRTGALPGELAYAVTNDVRAEIDGDEELCEYAVFTAAADAALIRLAEAGVRPRRRAVVSADVPEASVAASEAGPGVFELRGAVPRSAVAAIHVDSEELDAVLTAAVLSDQSVPESLDDQEMELEWYDVSELSVLCAELSPSTP